MFYPLIRMVPFVGLSIVAIKLSSVVFPEPDAPDSVNYTLTNFFIKNSRKTDYRFFSVKIA